MFSYCLWNLATQIVYWLVLRFSETYLRFLLSPQYNDGELGSICGAENTEKYHEKN